MSEFADSLKQKHSELWMVSTPDKELLFSFDLSVSNLNLKNSSWFTGDQSTQERVLINLYKKMNNILPYFSNMTDPGLGPNYSLRTAAFWFCWVLFQVCQNILLSFCSHALEQMMEYTDMHTNPARLC